MQDLILRAFRWYFVVGFVIAGMGLLHFADQFDTIKPVLPGLMCLGVAFIAGTAWKDLRRRILFQTIALLAVLAWVAQFVEDAFWVFMGRAVEINFFIGWAALAFIIGFPVMMFIYHRYGD